MTIDLEAPEDYDGEATTAFFDVNGKKYFKYCKHCEYYSFVNHHSPIRENNSCEGCMRKECSGGFRGLKKVKSLWSRLKQEWDFAGHNGM